MPTKGKTPSEATAPTRIKRSHGDLTSVCDGDGAPSRVSSDGAAGASGREGGQVAGIQRRRLLLAFTEVLAESGLEDAGVGRVCKRAGVSRRTFYDLFEDREACFLAVLDNAITRISPLVLAVHEQRGHTRGAGRWCERTRAALAVLLDLLDEDPALARVLLIETLKSGPIVSERRRRILDALASAIDEGRSEEKTGTGPPPLTAQSTVGGAVSVLHARILERDRAPLTDLLNPLMSMIVHPYLGAAAARRELKHHVSPPKPTSNGHAPRPLSDPFKDLPIRLTFRTARVLTAIAAHPGASNREIGNASGVADQGQISRLLSRLEGFELIENHGRGQVRGEANAWELTQRGQGVLQVVGEGGAAGAHVPEL